MFQLNPSETMQAVVRRNKITLVGKFFPLLVLMAALGLSFYLVKQNAPFIPFNYLLLILPVISLAICLKVYSILISWILDASVITTQRVITIEQYSLFHIEVATLELEKIQDVVVDLDGVLQNFFNFGTVTIKSASPTTDITLEQVSGPIVLKDTVLKLLNQRTSNQPPHETPPTTNIPV